MAIKGKASENKSGKTGGGMLASRRLRLFLAALTVITVIASLVALFWGATRFLFTGNDHLVLKKVKVFSTGWWNDKDIKVREVMNVGNGINLFAIDLRAMRERLEHHPSIRKASVARILPDTIAVKIVERIPRAFLFDSKSKWVVDETGMVMDRDTCIALDGNLPVIIGLDRKRDIKAGMELPELNSALELIMFTITEYHDFKIATVSVSNPRELRAIVYYKDYDRPYKAYMPSQNIREMLFVLRDCIAKAMRIGDPRRVVNLNYKGQAVLR